MLRIRLSLRVGHDNGAADGHDSEEIVDGEVEGEGGEGEDDVRVADLWLRV